MNAIRVALVGAGSMAANHARVIAASNDASVAVVVDRHRGRADRLAHEVGAAATTELSRAFGYDAAIVATATPAHAEAGFALIDAGVPVLVEKPLTTTLDETRQLVEAAIRCDGVLMCGLVERFNPAVAGLSAHVTSGQTQIRTERVGPAPPRVHSNVVDDLLLHDLDLVLKLAANDPVVDLQADAQDWWESVTCQLTFASGMTAVLHASRIASTRRRAYVFVDASGDEHYVNLLDVRGNALAKQFARFVHLVQSGTFFERDEERRSVLPGHELAHRVRTHLVEAGLPSCAS